MRFDYGYSEESKLGSPYDVKLLKRMLPFIRPYRMLLVISVALVIFITLFELCIPYITKIAIDRHIVPFSEISPEKSKASGNGKKRIIYINTEDENVRKVLLSHPDRVHQQDGKMFVFLDDLATLDEHTVRILRKDHLAGLSKITLAFLMVVAAGFVLNFLQKYIMEYAGHMIMHDLRMALYRHLQNLPISFYTKNPVARLVTRVTSDVQNMHELFTSVISMVFKDIFLLVGIATVLCTLNLKLALVSFLVLPFVLVAAFGFSSRVRDVFRELRVKVAQINTRFSETISGIKVIQSFCKESFNYNRFARLNHENYMAGMRQINIFAVFMPIIEMLGVTAIAIVIWSGGGSVLENTVSIGVLAAFIAYMKMFFRPIRDLAEKYNILQNAMASAERLFLLLDNKELQRPKIRPDRLCDPGKFNKLSFKGVSLAYNGNDTVLDDIQFTINAGETIAVVGPTGSGKTSLVNLIIRFYLPSKGKLMLNDIDFQCIDTDLLRSKIALVMQDPFLFSGTIEDNIFFSTPPKNDMKREDVLMASNCLDLIQRLPKGLKTPVSEGGASLSSGERQMLSIARAFSRNPELIIFDEATSYVDSETEIRLQKALDRLMTGRTCIIVAHRLTTARKADRIMVLNGGKIIETGNHDKLMAEKGFYYQLNRIQQNGSVPFDTASKP